MTRPLALDAYGCAGLMADGMRDAGWEVVVLDNDHRPLRHAAAQGHHTVLGDATQLLANRSFVQQFAWVHTAPPCQPSSATRELAKAQARARGRDLAGRAGAVDLIEPTRRLLDDAGVTWTLENVTRSVVRHWPGAVRLCGSSFGLQVERHRWFASSPDLELVGTACRHHTFPADPVTGKPRPWGVYGSTRDAIPSGGRTVRSIDHGHQVMGITWRRLPWRYLCEGMPAGFGQHIAEQVMAQVIGERAA